MIPMGYPTDWLLHEMWVSVPGQLKAEEEVMVFYQCSNARASLGRKHQETRVMGLFLFIVKTELHYVDQAGLELPEIYLPLSPECWD